jgi:hypothetical protein
VLEQSQLPDLATMRHAGRARWFGGRTVGSIPATGANAPSKRRSPDAAMRMIGGQESEGPWGNGIGASVALGLQSNTNQEAP